MWVADLIAPFVAVALLGVGLFSALFTHALFSTVWHFAGAAAIALAWAISKRSNRRYQHIIAKQDFSQREKSALLELALSATTYSGDIEAAARRITELSAETMGVERVSVWLFEDELSSIRCIDLYARSPKSHHKGFRLRYQDCPSYFEAIRRQRVLAIHDTQTDPLTKDFKYVCELNIGAMVDAPFHLAGRLAGIVCHEHAGGSRFWDADEQNFAASIADMMTRALQAAEKVRMESELKSRSKAIEASIAGIAILDGAECFTYMNQAHASIYGYDSAAELLGKSWRVLYADEELQRFEHEHMPQFRTNGVLRIEAEGLRKDGTYFPQRISLAKLDEGGLVCVCQDITAEKKLQSQLLQSHKMEAVGQLAGGVAHDFNNLLTGILGYTGLIKLRCREDAETYRNAELIESTASKASQLTFKLLGFARKGKHTHSPIDIHDIINDIFPLLSRTIEKNITLCKSLDAQRSIVMGDPVQIQQVLINLVINARDSMSMPFANSDGGSLTICTKSEIFDGSSPLPDPQLSLGRYLHISVTDSGCGIEPAIKDKIFEPFFTTKPQGKGTGLGLAMVYGIVRNHSGAVVVDSVVGKGTTFHIYLPLTEANLPSRIELTSALPARPKIIKGTGRILLVDDHSVIRDAGSKMLTSLGYHVVTAKDGIEALEYLRENSAEVDLVLIDMVMPRMGARECIREIKSINPQIKIVLATGYVRNHMVQEIVEQGISAFVQKPFQIESLSVTLEAVLNKPPLLPIVTVAPATDREHKLN